MALTEHRGYVVVEENARYQGRRVFATVCGDEGKQRIAVLQAPDYHGRPVRAFAGCVDGQNLDAWNVTAVPQGSKKFKGRRVFAFACCPGGSGSSGSGSAGSGSASGSLSASGSIVSGVSGVSGSSGSSASPKIPQSCCPGGLPAVVHVTISGVSPGSAACDQINGSWPLTYNPTSGAWEYTISTFGTWKLSLKCIEPSPFCQGFQFTALSGVVGCFNCGNAPNRAWTTCSCDPLDMIGPNYVAGQTGTAEVTV